MVGAVPTQEHPELELVSTRQYPVTAVSSVQVKEDIETVKLVAVEGIVKAVIVGGVVSLGGGPLDPYS